MSRFIILFDGNRAAKNFHTMNQVRTYLDRSVPDANEAEIYERRLVATRNQWSIAKTARAPKTTARSYKRWTLTESRKLVSLRKKGTPVKVIAQEFGRTPAAVTSMIAKLCAC